MKILHFYRRQNERKFKSITYNSCTRESNEQMKSGLPSNVRRLHLFAILSLLAHFCYNDNDNDVYYVWTRSFLAHQTHTQLVYSIGSTSASEVY